MAATNIGRVVAGGLVAGLIINVVEGVMNSVVLADAMKAVRARLGMPEPTGAMMVGFILIGFVLGIMIAWSYAAIRPRYGPGPRTALTAGIAIWVVGILLPVGMWMMSGAYPFGLGLIGLIYGLGEVVLAALAAGALYREEPGGRGAQGVPAM